MNLKKIAIAILIITIIVAQFSGFAFAAETPSVTIQLKSETADLTKLNREDEFEVLARIKEFKNVGKGILVVGGTLNYDSEKLELLNISGLNGWIPTSNQSNGKFVLEHDGYVNTDCDILKITFKVKADAVESTETTPSKAEIGLTNTTASGGEGVITVSNSKITATIVKPEPKPKRITSTVYKIDNNDWDISKIQPNTTIAQFLGNIVTENINSNEIVFTDKSGNVISNNTTVLRTEMVLKIADQSTYKIIVMGDIDGLADDRGRVITENDLAKIRLHFIGKEIIANTTNLKAADYDGDRIVTVNDIAMIKLNILGLINANK